MKFSNGHWLAKEGVSLFSPREAYFVDVTDTCVTICAPTIHINHKGDTLGGINLRITITSPAPDVFHIRAAHHRGALRHMPVFDLLQKDDQSLSVEESEDLLCITSGSTTMEINKKRWSVRYLRNGEEFTSSRSGDLALVKTAWTGMAYDAAGDTENTYIRDEVNLDVNETIYGLGERFTAFVKNGQSVTLRHEDGGTSTEQAYKNIPFFVSSKGYGVFINHPETVSLEVASELVTKVSFSVKGGYLDYYIMNGPSMKEVLEKYTDLTGKPSLPAAWTFGLWLSTSFTTDYDEDTVMHFIDGMLDRGIPLRTFHFDCCWMKEFHWTDFVWDNRIFPDPEGMLKRIKAKGINICCWINPYIAEESALFDEGCEKGYFVKRTNGDVWQWDMWQPGMALVDFTNPDACTWYQSFLRKLLQMGVDCFKTDFGERIPVENVVYYDHSNPEGMHNYYTYLYNQCVYEVIAQEKGKDQAVLFARSATVGGQKFPVHWGGDCFSDYVSMEESLRGGLSFQMSGFGYWAHDIGGFEATSTADVYKRWVAFGLLSSHSRLHGSSSYRVPWLYDEEAVDVVRFFTRLKASLMPYLYGSAVTSHMTGLPMMRSMVLEYPHDLNCRYLDKQYLLGESLLVAPVFNDRSKALYYLPAGTWTDFFTGEVTVSDSGKWVEEDCGYLDIPLMVRENSIIALGDHDDKPDYAFEKNPSLRIYALQDGASAQTFVPNEKGEKVVSVNAFRKGNTVTVSVDSPFAYEVVLVNEKASSVSGASYENTDLGCLFKASGSQTFTVTLA
ncbi:MAG: alpha-xylosidase [Lachnospiraceae bacterium]|nr:alpha-xylosidase [Lachnospiraceae bacterium]